MCSYSVTCITNYQAPVEQWSIYLVDKSTGIVLQRYPGTYSDSEIATMDLEKLELYLEMKRYILVVMKYDPHWSPK